MIWAGAVLAFFAIGLPIIVYFEPPYWLCVLLGLALGLIGGHLGWLVGERM